MRNVFLLSIFIFGFSAVSQGQTLPQATWVSGSDTINQYGIYGTKGIANPTNIPGARENSISWTDSADNFWFFGGYGYDRTPFRGLLNDLWKFDGTNWTWASGSEIMHQIGVYGSKGVADPNNLPGARVKSISWTDSEDNFWLCGGQGFDGEGSNGILNDLWKFDGTNWTWVSGSDIKHQIGVYGSKGVADANNVPGAKDSSISWIDSNDNLWLFGGQGNDSIDNWGVLNDLWKFDGTNWTWVSGPDIEGQPGIYGSKGAANPANVPGSRHSSISWIDNDDNLWLFGGWGNDSIGNGGILNDLWKYDGTNWTWISGSDIRNQSGVYGIKGISDPANVPGSRTSCITWFDSGNLWLFGGDDFNGLNNDLWKFDGTNWTWVIGSDTVNQNGVYGVKGVADPVNIPGARKQSISRSDSSGYLGGLDMIASVVIAISMTCGKFKFVIAHITSTKVLSVIITAQAGQMLLHHCRML